jgi:hypothetical protein
MTLLDTREGGNDGCGTDMKRFLLATALALSCSTPTKIPAGVWQMGQVASPTSSLEDQFPASAWAKNLGSGSYVGLAEDGKIYSGLPKEGPLLEGSWSDKSVTFSFDSQSAKNLTMKTVFRGTFEPQSDAISGKLTQTITLSNEVSIEYTGDISFARVTQ